MPGDACFWIRRLCFRLPTKLASALSPRSQSVTSLITACNDSAPVQRSMSKQGAQIDFHYSQPGRRVFLSKPDADCETEILDAARRSEDLHHPWVFPPSNHEEYESYLERIREGRTIGFLVRYKSDNCLAGVVNASEPVMGVFRSAYLGFYAFSGFAAKGYMTEGMSLLLDYAFEELGFHRLEANVQPANFASSRMVERL